jgi:thioredoxin reductase
MAKTPERIRPCVGAAYCIDRIYAGRAAFCLHNPATGREAFLPQSIARSAGPNRKVAIVGGGPAGLEAARVSALRGHDVTLFEAGSKLGGQLLIASTLAWRRDLIGIVDWLAAEVERLGVKIHFNTFAEADLVLTERPEVVIIATGGTPRAPDVPGSELAMSSWDAAGQAGSFSSALIYDVEGGHAAISLAQHLSSRGCEVTVASNDRVFARSLGGSSYPVYLGALAESGVRIITDHRLATISRFGNQLRATLAHEYAKCEQVIVTDRVVAELGTEPADQLFHDLKPLSRNRGATDVDALQAGGSQPWFADGERGMVLFRVGDAVASRDVHAAMLDSLRLLKDC